MSEQQNKEEGWVRHYRDDKGIWEDTCPHGIGHENGVHGCDGCCEGLYYTPQSPLTMEECKDHYQKGHHQGINTEFCTKKELSIDERLDGLLFNYGYENFSEYAGDKGEKAEKDLLDFINQEISSAVSQALKEQRDTTLKLIDKYYLQYCREQNGLDQCKNCGLNIEELEKLLSNNK